MPAEKGKWKSSKWQTVSTLVVNFHKNCKSINVSVMHQIPFFEEIKIIQFPRVDF